MPKRRGKRSTMPRANPLTIIRRYHTDERLMLKAMMLVLAKRPLGAAPGSAMTAKGGMQDEAVPPGTGRNGDVDDPK